MATGMTPEQEQAIRDRFNVFGMEMGEISREIKEKGASLTASLPEREAPFRVTECDEAVSRRGEYQPCGKRAVAIRRDPDSSGLYPVCKHHTRGEVLPLAEVIAAYQQHVARPSFDEVEKVLNEWLLEDVGPSVFDRGLHILAHLKRGGTLEQYGRPSPKGSKS